MAHSPTRPDVRIGIVGCGRAAGTLHLPALARVRGVALTALSDVDPARLAALGSRCAGASCYPDYRLMLEDERVELVAICVPVTGHAEIAEASLRAGKHVFVEKPLALELEDCDRLVDLANRADASGQRSVVGFNLRSHRLVRQARSVIQSGALGDIELVRTLWTADWSGATRPTWHASREQGGGALLEIGTHQADLWRWLLGSDVQSVHADTRSSAFDDQSATLQVRMANGVLVTGAVSQRSVSHNVVEILGSRGSLSFSCYHADSLTVTATGGAHTGALAADPTDPRQGGPVSRRLPGRARWRRLPHVLRPRMAAHPGGTRSRWAHAGLDLRRAAGRGGAAGRAFARQRRVGPSLRCRHPSPPPWMRRSHERSRRPPLDQRRAADHVRLRVHCHDRAAPPPPDHRGSARAGRGGDGPARFSLRRVRLPWPLGSPGGPHREGVPRPGVRRRRA